MKKYMKMNMNMKRLNNWIKFNENKDEVEHIFIKIKRCLYMCEIYRGCII